MIVILLIFILGISPKIIIGNETNEISSNQKKINGTLIDHKTK